MRGFVFSSIFFLGAVAGAHGEDKPGPHGGSIRMPGGYHTELVSEGDGVFKIYLLDIGFKSPMTMDSTVSLEHESGKITPASCRIEDRGFVCRFPKTTDLSSGKLKLISKRGPQSGNEAVYDLPLRPAKPKTPKKTSNPHHH